MVLHFFLHYPVNGLSSSKITNILCVCACVCAHISSDLLCCSMLFILDLILKLSQGALCQYTFNALLIHCLILKLHFQASGLLSSGARCDIS